MIIPPLLKLRWFGLVCPCLEDHEDTAARVALKSLSQVPVRWHRSASGSAALAASGSSTTDSVGGFVSSLFGGASSPSASSSSSCQKIDGSLDLVDSSSSTATATATGVCIQITPGAIANNDTVDGELSMKQSGGYIKTVLLRTIESAALVSDGGIMGMARSAMQKSSSSSNNNNSNGGGGGNIFVLVSSKNNQELLRFEILNKGNGKSVGSVEREEFLQHLNNLFAWDKKRRAALNHNESNNDDDDTADDDADADTNDDEQFSQNSRNKSSPRAMGRAAKAAHFARREIELSKTKREREKKKAKYMEGSAGLKYTAIAMANRA
eukprot:scaffold28828_cov62-Attheya_sp.AAC.1